MVLFAVILRIAIFILLLVGADDVRYGPKPVLKLLVRIPFSFVTNLFGFHRNHYDRVAHFSVGFYAFAIAEALVRAKAVRSRLVLFLFPVFAIAFVAMGYELIEWWYAVSASGASGAAFLGSQGDVWDAQKDMLADTLGAIVATTSFFIAGRTTTAR